MTKTSQPKYKETEVGLIPEDWKILKFNQIAELKKEPYLPKAGDNLPYLGLEHIDQQTLSINSVGSSDSVNSNKSKFKSGDILFGKLRPYFKKIYQPKFDGVCSTDIWVIKAKDTTDQDWLHWFVANQDFVDMASSGSKGTKMPRADWGQVSISEWPVPPIEEQQKIAEVLGVLDEKIELNRKMNKTLESLAQAVFKKWFIDDADPDWETKKLGDITNISIGRTPPRKEECWFSTNPDDVKWVSIKDMGNCGIFINKTSEYLTEEAITKFNVPVIPANTLILSFKLTIGRLAITAKKMVSNEAIAHLKLKNQLVSNEYLFHFLRSFDFSILGSTSSIAAAVNSQSIKSIDILIPSSQRLTAFNNAIIPIHKRIRLSEQEIETLSQIRDSLLPRLMSGKLRVR